MANKIQIKRSTTTAAPTGLANGELAYSANGGVLFIGAPADGTTLAIGGLRNPGTLTANQALVANSTSGIDKVLAANVAAIDNLYVGANVIANTTAYFVGNSSVNTFITQNLLDLGGQINANGSVGTAGQILTSGAGGNVYWGAAPSGITDITDSANATTVTIISSTGADAVLESANATAAGILTSADWTKLNNMPANSVAGSDTQVMFNNAGVLAGDAGFTFVTATDALALGGAALTTAPIFRVANSAGSANLTSATLTIGTSVVNSTAVAAGANVYLNTTTLFAGNSTINASHTSSLVQVANSTGTANLTATTLTIGTSVVNSSAVAAGSNAYINTTAVFISTNSTINSTHTAALVQVANSTSTANLTAAGLVVGISGANTTALYVGANVFANSSAFDVGNTVITSTNLTLGGQVTANGLVGTAGQVLTSGAAGNVYWTTPTTGTVTSVGSGNGLTGGPITSTGSLSVLANTGIIANSSGVFVNPVLSLTDLTLSGNLDVNGTLTTVDTTNLSVTDSIISLARGQTTANTLDIGFYGTYGNATVTSYTGLFRDATDSKYKLFAGAIPEPTTTVDTANVNYAGATLVVQALEGASATAFVDNFILDGGTF